jgi:inorganic pyrophosphatase
VPVSDPIGNTVNDLDELNPHLLKEIEHFFRVYKDLEKKKVDVDGWGGVLEAREIIAKCINRYAESDIPSGDVSIR